MPTSFAPIIERNTRVLIVGTMPGAESLRQREYYAQRYNQFWKIMADMFNDGAAWTSYQHKIEALRANRVGLWDALKACDRDGSLDAAIKNPVPNDFTPYRYVRFLFNGRGAFAYFRRYNGHLLREGFYAVLPSTSPAYAAMRYADKLALWRKEVLK